MTLRAHEVSLAGRLEDVSFTLTPGSVTAICGPNGAGKSSLLKALAGLLDIDAGQVALDGADLATLHPRARARSVGYLPQDAEVAWDVPVRNLVALGRVPHGDSRAEPVDAALAALDMTGFAERRAQSLSGGETARMLLARVLAGEPQWILADEPLAALDLAHQLSLLGHLRGAAQSGAGVVLVLHDLAHAMNYADNVVLLDEGRLVAHGRPQEVLYTSAIESVWGVPTKWLGEPGKWALVPA